VGCFWPPAPACNDATPQTNFQFYFPAYSDAILQLPNAREVINIQFNACTMHAAEKAREIMQRSPKGTLSPRHLFRRLSWMLFSRFIGRPSIGEINPPENAQLAAH
jgi:hypothetical protein